MTAESNISPPPNPWDTIGCDVGTVIRWIMHDGGLRCCERKRSPRRLSLAEREEIAVGIARGESGAVIGRRLGRACSTITREIARSVRRQRYRASAADRRALEKARRPKQPKPARCERLRREAKGRPPGSGGLPSRSQRGWPWRSPTTRR